MTSQAYPRPFPREDLFWRHVDKSGSCWEWTGSKSIYGYGVVTRQTNHVVRHFMAHRVAYEMAKGPMPPGLVTDHLCRNTLCVRPDHLEAVTDRVNILRGVGVSAIQARRTHCPKGHEYTGQRAKRGERVCVECVRIKNLKWYAIESERMGRKPHNRFKTHCLRGHPLDGPDVYIDKRGRRQCRACERFRHHQKAAA
jgi:hypothetical protein